MLIPTSFDGCGRRCRKTLAHTFVYGECEHAPLPEPTVSMSHVFTGSDGQKSISFDAFTVQQLANLIEPALRAAGVSVSHDQYAWLAHAAARKIVHRNDTQPHSCSNCEGVDPDTCLMNPNRPPEQCPNSEADGYGLQCQKLAGHNLCTFEEERHG